MKATTKKTSKKQKKNQKIDWTRHCKCPSDKIKKQLDIIMSKGLDVNSYFSLLNNGVQQLYKYKDDIPVAIKDDDPDVIIKKKAREAIKKISEEIKADIDKNGYIKNTKLYRRFVMAHFFRMMAENGGFNKALQNLGYKYSFEMALEELRVLSILERNDTECFNERSRFFTKQVVLNMISHDITSMGTILHNDCNPDSYVYLRNARKYVGRSIIQDAIANGDSILNAMCNCSDYLSIYLKFKEYCDTVRVDRMSKEFEQCDSWKMAYESNGAFYTLKNMILFHDCVMDKELTKEENFNELKNMSASQYTAMFVKDFAEANEFDFNQRMAELYN